MQSAVSHGGHRMRRFVQFFWVLTVAIVALGITLNTAEAKKKKIVPSLDCSSTESTDPCPAPDASANPAPVQAALTKSQDGSAPIPPQDIPPAQSQTAKTANANANANANTDTETSEDEVDTSDWYIGTMPDQPYDIPLVDRSKMDAKFERQDVAYDGKEPVGSVVVDIDHRFLYFIESEGKAIRYGIGVGRLGFSWRGNAIIGRKGVWPHWTPTDTMRKIIPHLPAGMDGGVDSPLGARAMYLYQDGHDIMFRIHGTNEPWSIGEQVSSGCIRLLNEDVVDLYERTKIGTQVFVRNSKHGTGMKLSTADNTD